MRIVSKFPLAVASMALLLAVPMFGCGGDLGEPVNRYTDWDASQPMGDGGQPAVNTVESFLPDCGPDYYPCPPYGPGRGDVIENFRMAAANAIALDYADSAGIMTLADLHQSGAKLLFVFLTAGW